MKIDIPASIGELIDKITILEIKKSKINDVNKSKDINKELILLNEVVLIKKVNKIKILHLKKDLKKINLMLWNVEDKLRKMEGKKQFDKIFIKNARNVYLLNDKRSAVKSKINTLTKSSIKEVKSYESY